MRSFLLSAALALSGCPDTLLPDARIRAETEAYLSQPVIEVLARHEAGFNRTRYEVSTLRGRYACFIYGGHALDFGIISAMACAGPDPNKRGAIIMSDTTRGNRGGRSRDQAASIADSRSFGEEYRERLIALGRAQERASMAREEVQETRREVQDSRPAEAARRGRSR